MVRGKVIFIGNTMGGDDGIGPHLYSLLKDDSRLKDFDLHELGVIGFDLLNYVDDKDRLIIVDALHSVTGTGNVRILEEGDLSADLALVSSHDFGVEQTATIIRAYKPNITSLHVIGIEVPNITEFSTELSAPIAKKTLKIKEEVVSRIIQLGGQ